MMTPMAEMPAYHGFPIAFEPNAPSRIVNSPTKPFNPGKPIDESEAINMIVPKIGMTFHKPP